jgi:uncharacterized membrane protein
MTRRKWLWATLVAVPAVVVGGLAVAGSQTARTYTCPLTGELLPCPKCCPLNQQQGAKEAYTCPLTGEQLPCPACCPLNDRE